MRRQMVTTMYNNRPNWTPLSPVTITYYYYYYYLSLRFHKNTICSLGSPLKNTFLGYFLLCFKRWLYSFESVDEIRKCDHSSESSY